MGLTNLKVLLTYSNSLFTMHGAENETFRVVVKAVHIMVNVFHFTGMGKFASLATASVAQVQGRLVILPKWFGKVQSHSEWERLQLKVKVDYFAHILSRGTDHPATSSEITKKMFRKVNLLRARVQS